MTTIARPTDQYASPIDVARYGVYRGRRPDDNRPLLRFTGRLSADGSTWFRAEPGRYHLYAGWFCPWAHRITIVRGLLGLEDVISVSYVDGLRDGRGWAFRASTGPDPVNGFTLLRQAYEATEPGFDGHVSVPALWDRASGQLVSNDYRLLGLDLATQFGQWARPGVDLYPEGRRDAIDRLDDWIGPEINHGVTPAATDPAVARRFLAALGRLEAELGARRYLAGDTVTLADVNLWVTLVRYDVGPNAQGRIGPPLSSFPRLWAYARDLYRQPAFGATTDFARFAAPLTAIPEWTPAARSSILL